ncbi:aminoglycoside phosphotransferase family protein [Denitrobaculum tricleocarpae]|nr:aminoglycoside phosphotransferase family protein [Denitrobaculum tricleocarpae]
MPDGQVTANLAVTLRAHRLGKRAVLQFDSFDAEPKRVFAKLRPISNTSGRRAYERHVALFERLRGAVELPRPLGFDPNYGAASFSALPGISPTFEGSEPALIAQALRRLQRVPDLPVEHHTVTDELTILRAWCDRIHEVFPDRTDRFAEAFDLVRDDLHRLPHMPPVPCHRDFHEGQILVDGNSIGLLDFDTLRLSDPALDVGNLIAHLRLAGIRSGRRRLGAEAAIITAMDPIPANRILTWTRAALLRLAAIYSFTSERRATLRSLMEDVIWPDEGF